MEKKRDYFCVYCGSSPGKDGAYLSAAHDLGRAMAEQGIGLVYGGASIGIMGAVADAVSVSYTHLTLPTTPYV